MHYLALPGIVLTENLYSASTAFIIRISLLHYVKVPGFLRESTPSFILRTVASNKVSDTTTQILIWSNKDIRLGIMAGSLDIWHPREVSQEADVDKP